MTKAEIIDNIHRTVGLTKKEISFIIDDVFDTMKKEVIKGNSIKLSGFGNFDVKTRGRRVGRNLKTGVEKIIEPRVVLIFRPSQKFKKELNGE